MARQNIRLSTKALKETLTDSAGRSRSRNYIFGRAIEQTRRSLKTGGTSIKMKVDVGMAS